IKVTYNSTKRILSIPEAPKWSDLDERIRTLFSFSPDINFTLSYTDEEFDIITISTDLEIQELISTGQKKNGTMIKLTLKL
ncbi:7831_t:CDS:1, partial [Entrophospora sp. SA101]